MVSLAALVLPIVLSAVLVFLASFVLHMLLSFHRADYRKVAAEDAVMDALRGFSIAPGDYAVPNPERRSPNDPEFVAKRKKGPVLVMTVFPTGEWNMARLLAMWFVFCLVVGLFVAYVASITVTVGASYRVVFHITSVVAFIAYGMALWELSIWYHRSWATTLRSNIDALVYGLLTGGAFGWLWPR
jgi:ABC-type sugar transport system permease subunit